MSILEVFFDYACPYCKRGHEYLVEMIKDFPNIRIEWRPCEAHPHPEPGPHSDILIQGMFYALDHGVDIWKYHERMYKACHKDKLNREDVAAVADYAADLLNADDFIRVVGSGKYEKIQRDGNDYAYEKKGIWALPSYRINGRKLDSVEEIGVSATQLRELLSQ